jgi:hypothetical protein
VTSDAAVEASSRVAGTTRLLVRAAGRAKAWRHSRQDSTHGSSSVTLRSDPDRRELRGSVVANSQLQLAILHVASVARADGEVQCIADLGARDVGAHLIGPEIQREVAGERPPDRERMTKVRP